VRGYRYSVNGKYSIFRSDEVMTVVGSMRCFRTVILCDEIEASIDLRRFVLRRFRVTTVLETAKNVKKKTKRPNVNTGIDVKKQHN